MSQRGGEESQRGRGEREGGETAKGQEGRPWCWRGGRCCLGKGATAAVPSAPTVNLHVIIDVSVPMRKKTGCCEQSGPPCPHCLSMLRQGPAPAAASIPSLLTCLQALVSSTQPPSPPPSLMLPRQRRGPPAWGEHGSGRSHVAHGWWPCPRVPGATDPAARRGSTSLSHCATSSI